jgi:hypothetical protein
MHAHKISKPASAEAAPPRAKHPAVAHGVGRSLDAGVRQTMESRFGHDFTGVRIHNGAPAGVRALTQGHDIVFGSGQYVPTTERGRRLIAHELAHVVQQLRATRRESGGTNERLEREADRVADAALAGISASITATSAPLVQYKIEPEGVASEMVGRTFEVISGFASGSIRLAIGDTVRVDRWNVDAGHSVEVTVLTGPASGQKLIVPQHILRPAKGGVAGLSSYSAGVGKQAAAVESSERALAAWQAKKGSFTTPKGLALFTREEARLETTLAKKRDVLNRREIQEAMFNRFDAVIEREVVAANRAHGLAAKDALDPDLVKAQLFQESQLGTAGEHMSDPPVHLVKTRFNLGQVIDSSAAALLTLMEAGHKPLVIKYALSSIRRDLAAAQAEKEKLEKKKSLNTAETTRATELRKLAHQSWEPFLWQYKAPGQAKGFADAVAELFSLGKPVSRNLDYEFWIHLAVFWLFEKKKKGMSWGDAIRAYNGSGARAEHYRAAVIKCISRDSI